MTPEQKYDPVRPHQWTNGGDEVMVLRFSDLSGRSCGGFQHPLEVGGVVEAPDWNTERRTKESALKLLLEDVLTGTAWAAVAMIGVSAVVWLSIKLGWFLW